LGGADAKTVTINRNGALLGTFAFAKGTVISAVDDHRGSQLLADGRWEFHGAFELRALPDKEPAPYQNTPAEVLMSDAPVVVSAHGVDVILECLPEQ
jgi:hypothetical protein